MTDFRTRRKDGQVFPVRSGKVFRQIDDYEPSEKKPSEETPSEEKVLEEKLQKEKAKKKHKSKKPSFTTKSSVKSDIKKIMRDENSGEHGAKDYVHYRRKLNHYAEKKYKKENKKAKRQRKKELKKEQNQKEKE